MTTKPPSGTRDFLPDDIRRREHVLGIVRRVYEHYGFEPLETPAFENIETLLGKYGEEGNKLIFKILKRGEHEASGRADLALRYDLTVPLARVIAQYQNELPKFFKRYQIQPVWRADRPGHGRFREFYQCDIDAIGSASPVVEAELLGAVSDVLCELGFNDFKILLNDRRILTGLLVAAGISTEQHATALVALDKRDKIGEKGVAAEFSERGIAAHAAERVMDILRDIYATPLDGTPLDPDPVNASRLKSLQHVLAGTDAIVAVNEARGILKSLEGTRVAAHVYLDPKLARGLSYYTGVIMEITVPDLAGSLGGGGRYDNLIGTFLGKDVPACGFSLGLERIIVVMTERAMFPDAVSRGAADVMVVLWNDDVRADALSLAGELRRGGLRTEVYPEADKTGKQLKYASGRRFPFVAIVGDDERASGVVAIKNMTTTAQATIPRPQAAAYIRRQLSETKKDGE